MSYYVYLIVNKVNQKLYFGSHCWNGDGVDPNYYGSGKIIKQAIEKYGKDNFIVYPIQFYSNAEECRKAEEELLTRYDIANNPYCYNIKNSAIGWDKGKKHTEETRKKISQANKGKKRTEEARKKLSQANKGKTLSDEHRQKLSESKKGENNPNYGKHHTDEHRKKLSQANNYRKIPVVAIQLSTGKIRVFESQIECARQLNLDRRLIYSCLKGRIKQTKGYTFKYAELPESVPSEDIIASILR